MTSLMVETSPQITSNFAGFLYLLVIPLSIFGLYVSSTHIVAGDPAATATIAFIFWSLWLLPLGYLVFRSGFLPKILGVLLMIPCLGYLINSFEVFLGYTVNIGMVSAVGGTVVNLLASDQRRECRTVGKTRA